MNKSRREPESEQHGKPCGGSQLCRKRTEYSVAIVSAGLAICFYLEDREQDDGQQHEEEHDSPWPHIQTMQQSANEASRWSRLRGRCLRGQSGSKYPMLRCPDHKEEKQTPRTKSQANHHRKSNDVQHAWQRPLWRAQFRKQHDCRDCKERQQRAAADSVLSRDDPCRKPAIDPLILVGDRSSQNVRDKHKQPASSQREKTIPAPRMNA